MFLYSWSHGSELKSSRSLSPSSPDSPYSSSESFSKLEPEL